MGLPVRDDENAVENRAGLAAVYPESVNMGEDAAQTLDEKAKKALECPCVADLRDGPCGAQFSAAFVCFLKSQEPEKGSDCVEPFTKMQECMMANSRKFVSADVSDPPLRTGHRLPTEDDDEESGNEENDTISKSLQGPAMHPPQVPADSIRLPTWYTQKHVPADSIGLPTWYTQKHVPESGPR